MTDDLLKRTTNEIRARIKELEPQVREYERLQGALAALDARDAPQKRERGRRPTQTARRKQGTKRRAGRGQRKEQLLRVVGEEPGLRPSEAARRVGIQPSQLHTLARGLQEEGSIERRDGALFPASASAGTTENAPRVDAQQGQVPPRNAAVIARATFA